MLTLTSNDAAPIEDRPVDKLYLLYTDCAEELPEQDWQSELYFWFEDCRGLLAEGREQEALEELGVLEDFLAESEKGLLEHTVLPQDLCVFSLVCHELLKDAYGCLFEALEQCHRGLDALDNVEWACRLLAIVFQLTNEIQQEAF